MKIDKIELRSFRNYDELSIELDRGINIITGNNAQGKSNFLESIYFSAFSRSFRTQKDKELVQGGEDFASVVVYFTSNREEKIEIKIDKAGKKQIKVNSNQIQKISDLIGKLKVVSFVPEDVLLIKGQPIERRRFMNKEISQIYPAHISELIDYTRVLSQRNAAIKKHKIENASKELISIWDEQLSGLAEKIIKRRIDFIEKINIKANDVHHVVTEKNEIIKVQYKSFSSSQNSLKYDKIRGDFMDLLRENLEQDIRYGYTVKGPHKDDFEVYIDDLPVKIYGSQGQKRTAALSIKLAQIEYIKEFTEEEPIILLDDVSSELDINRRRCLFDYIKDYQSFISTTDINDYIGFDIPIKEYYVKNGELFIK